MTKLFITGATGYIGGDALYAVAQAYPDLEITALVRNSDKGAKIASQYANVRLVYGDLDSKELLLNEASTSDIVLHTANCDHEGAAQAIIAGLAVNKKKTHLIFTSGCGSLCYEDLDNNTYGIFREKQFDDWGSVQDVLSLPSHAPHAKVEKLVLSANEQHPTIDVALISPSCIYGPGRGPDNQRSMQIYDMAKVTLERQKGFLIGEGKNLWNETHVQDLSDMIVTLLGAALNPEESKATWNKEGYYFAVGDQFVWGDMGRKIAEIAFEKKLIDTSELDIVSKEEADAMRRAGAFLWGTNSRCNAIRARKLLGWSPKQKTMLELLPEIVDDEALALGLIKSHAEKAAGAS